MRSDADGYAANLPASISPANPNLSVQAGDIFFLNTDITSNQNGSTIALSGAAFTNISVARTFRFYGFNAEGTGGTFSIDNVLIDGVATAPAVLNADFSATSVCLGNVTAFTDLSTGPNTIVSWLWDFGDGLGTSVSQNPLYTFAAGGTYTVTLMVTDNMANTDSYVATVSVYENPVAGITSDVNSGCSALVVSFSDLSTIVSGTITNWDWNFGDPLSGAANTSTLQNPQHTYYTQMIYTATEIVTSDMGCKDTATISIMVDSIGVSYTSSISGPTVTFTGSVWGGTPGYAFMWEFGDATTDFSSNPIHTYSSPGTYLVCFTATDMNGCSDSTCTSVVIVTVGIGSQSPESAINIAPHPSNNGVFTLNSTKASVNVYNVLGKIIMTKEIVQGDNTIDLTAEANGSYFITIQTEKESITKKLIINK